MPIYEYRCESCETHFEVLQRVNDDGKDLTCPQCGHHRVEKQFSAFATAGGSQGNSSANKSNRSRSCGSGGFS
jgi:putative FmdB family regulatory protein